MMSRHRTTIIVLVLLGLVSALAGLLGNVASNQFPRAWEPYLWLAWPLFGLFTLAGVGLAIWQFYLHEGPGMTQETTQPTLSTASTHKEDSMAPRPPSASNEQFAYDLFISYSSKDRAWVRGELLPRLEESGLRACIDFRDFQLGAPGVTEMERVVLTSRKTLLVLTPRYLESEWAEFENLMLQTLDPAARGRRLIPLLKEKCELPLRIRFLTYVDFADPEDWDLAWTRLLGALEAPDTEAPPPAREEAPPAEDRPALVDLRQKLIDRCSLSDLKDLCFIMGIDSDNYTGGKTDFIRDLLKDLQKWGCVDEFIETVRREKDWVLR